ncbi:hypothetical protein ABN034_04260 [Actinopolymorpha sp. B11F2]|uniref:hypothetical protein n=1 Tax=Actinopolymorpha sp. B11F2 TaxID=3160862 RepID=UPI0032E3E506
MRLYADAAGRRLGQVVGDMTALAWLVLTAHIASSVHERVGALAAPGRRLEGAGQALRRQSAAAQGSVNDVPGVGDAIGKPLNAIAQTGQTVAAIGRSHQSVVGDVALLLALGVGAAMLSVVLVWVARRIRWVRRATEADALSASAGGTKLLAFRALSRAPVSKLRPVAPDPAGAWLRGDDDAVRRLADVELTSLGLHLARAVGSKSP